MRLDYTYNISVHTNGCTQCSESHDGEHNWSLWPPGAEVEASLDVSGMLEYLDIYITSKPQQLNFKIPKYLQYHL